MLDFFSADVRRDPFPLYAHLRSVTPVLHVPASDLYVLLDYDSVKRALTDHEAFGSNVSPSRGLSFEWLLFMDPPRHTQLRNIIARAFTPRSIYALEPRIREISRDLLDAVIERGAMDLTADYAAPLPLMVIAELVGMPPGEWQSLRRWSDAIIGLGSTIAGTEESSKMASARFLAANDEMAEYVGRLLVERRSTPRDDLLTRMLDAEIDGERLSELEILRFVQLLVAAGTETTTNLVDNAILSLLDEPAQHAILEREPARIPAAIEEVLRYRSPAQVMFRVTRREVVLHGVTIPAGKFILVALGSANRDASHFADADRFDIARDPNPHLAFGHGFHFCIGASLSRLEARVALGDLLARVRGIERASDEPWTPREAFHVHGPTSLPIRFRPSDATRAGRES